MPFADAVQDTLRSSSQGVRWTLGAGKAAARQWEVLLALPFAACATPARHGKATEESVHSSVSLHAVHLWDHDGTEDPEAQWRLLGSGSGLGAPADDRGEDGPALRVPWRHRVPGSSPPGWQQHQSSFVQFRPRGDHILWCSYFLLHLVRQPTHGRQIHSLGPHPGSTLGPQNRFQLPERETHAAGGHRHQFLPRTQSIQLQGPGRVGVPHGTDRSFCSRYSSEYVTGGGGGRWLSFLERDRKKKELSVVFRAQKLHRYPAPRSAKLLPFRLRGTKHFQHHTSTGQLPPRSAPSPPDICCCASSCSTQRETSWL